MIPFGGPVGVANYAVSYAHALFLTQLAYKDQLVKLRAVVADYQLVHQSVLYALKSKEVQGIDFEEAEASEDAESDANPDELLPTAKIIERELVELILIEAMVVDVMAVLELVVEKIRAKDGVCEYFLPIDTHFTAFSKVETTDAERLLRLHPRDLCAEIDKTADEREHVLSVAALRLLSHHDLQRLIKGKKVSIEQAKARPRTEEGVSLLVRELVKPASADSEGVSLLVRAPVKPASADCWVGPLCGRVEARALARQRARANRIVRAFDRAAPRPAGSAPEPLPSMNLAPLGLFLSELGECEAFLKKRLQLLASARKTIARWVGSAGPGYPMLPSYHKQDRSQHYRAFHRILDRAASTVYQLGRLSHARPPEVANAVVTFSFTDRTSTEESGDGNYAVECPAFYLDHPRYFADVFHECAHASIPSMPPISDETMERLHERLAVPLEAYRLRERARLGPEFSGHLFDTIATELIVDAIAAASCGPYYGLALTVEGLARTGWFDGSNQRDFDPIVRGWSVFLGGLDHWFREYNHLLPGPCRGGGGQPSRAASESSDSERFVSDPYLHLAVVVDRMLHVHRSELQDRAAGVVRARLPLGAQQTAGIALRRTDGADDQRELVRCVLDELAKLAHDASDVWIARRPTHDQAEADLLERARKPLDTFTRDLLGPATMRVHGRPLDLYETAPLAVAVLPAREGTRLRTWDFLVRNTIHLGWHWWVEATLRAWGPRAFWRQDGASRATLARPALCAWESVEDAPLFAFLASAARAQERMAPAERDARDFDQEYFGVGIPITLALYDCLWSTSEMDTKDLAGWLTPTAADNAERVLTALGEMDQVAVHPRHALVDLRRPATEIGMHPQPTHDAFYVRHVDFELVPLRGLVKVLFRDPTTEKQVFEALRGAYVAPESASKTSSADVVKQLVDGPDESVFVLLQHVQRTQRTPKPVGIEAHLAFHRRILGIDGTGTGPVEIHPELDLAGFMRSFTWTDTAVWWNTKGDPVVATRKALQLAVASRDRRGHGDDRSALRPLSETFVLYRQTNALVRLVGQMIEKICRDAPGALEALRALVEVVQEMKIEPSKLSPSRVAIAFHMRLWISRKDADQLDYLEHGRIGKALKPVRDQLNRLGKAVGWKSVRPRLTASVLMGGADFSVRLIVPALPSTLVAADAQALVALLHLLVARSAAEILCAFEVVTTLELVDL